MSSWRVLRRVFALIALSGVLALGMGCSTSGSGSGAESGSWQKYADSDGDSSVDSYQLGADYIRIRFKDGSVYMYSNASAGAGDVQRMKDLAASGDGLNAYITANAKYDYEGGSTSGKGGSGGDTPEAAVAYMQEALRLAKAQQASAAEVITLLLKYEDLGSKEQLHALLLDVDSASWAISDLKPPPSLVEAHEMNVKAMEQLDHSLRSYNLYLSSNRVMPSDLDDARTALSSATEYRSRANSAIQAAAQQLSADLPLLPSLDAELD